MNFAKWIDKESRFGFHGINELATASINREEMISYYGSLLRLHCENDFAEKVAKHENLKTKIANMDKCSLAGIPIDWKEYNRVSEAMGKAGDARDLAERKAAACEDFPVVTSDEMSSDRRLVACLCHAYFGQWQDNDKVKVDEVLSVVSDSFLSSDERALLLDCGKYVKRYDAETDWTDERKEEYKRLREAMGNLVGTILGKENFNLSSKTFNRLLRALVVAFTTTTVKEKDDNNKSTGFKIATLRKDMILTGYSLTVAFCRAIASIYG